MGPHAVRFCSPAIQAGLLEIDVLLRSAVRFLFVVLKQQSEEIEWRVFSSVQVLSAGGWALSPVLQYYY